MTIAVGLMTCFAGGCATIRVTDPPRTADEEFLLTEAATKAISQLSMEALRGRVVWVATEFAFSTTQPYDGAFLTNEIRSPAFQDAFMVAELRARLLQSGVRLASSRSKADVILEVRTGALSINRIDFLLGLPATFIPGATATAGSTSIPLALPQLAAYQSIEQRGFGSVAFVAYWKDTGELLATSGPYIGRTWRTDYFLFGYHVNAVGNIPPTEVGAGATPQAAQTKK